MNGMPMPGAKPAVPQGQSMPQQQSQGSAAGGGMIPPELAQHIDPRNPVQALLLKRMDTLDEQEVAALTEGIAPEAALALKKILPELGFLIDALMQDGAGAEGDDGGEPMPQPRPAPQPQPMGMARSRLASV